MRKNKVVLVVGAGPTGLTIALELGRFGVPVRLIDRYAEPSDTSRALAVQSRTMEIMQQRGLADEMVRIGNPGRVIVFHADGKELGRVDLQAIDSRFNYMMLLPQSDTERILRESLERAGVEVERRTELIAFAQRKDRPDGVQATLRKADGRLEEVEAAYLIAAEGAHSLVRQSMDLPFEGDSLPHSYALADLHLDGPLPEDQLSLFVPRTGLVVAFPMGHHRFRVIASEKTVGDEDAPPPDLAYIQHLWDIGSHVPVHFRDMVWSSRFRINSRALGQLRHGNVFFGGDSAHVHSPAGGQGMNTGIQDMINLGWKLAAVYRGIAVDALLDTYDEERLPVIREVLSDTERATNTFNSDSSFVHTLINHAMPIALGFEKIRQKGRGIITEFAANYRASSLTGIDERVGTIHAGDRFPDVLLQQESDVRALDILDPSLFTLLILGASGDRESIGAAADPALFKLHRVVAPGSALTAVTGDAEAVIVRPDGYVFTAGTMRHVLDRLGSLTTKWLPMHAAVGD